MDLTIYYLKMQNNSSSSEASTEQEARPLRGMKIVVTAIDLEQTEHRGIAVYSKAVLRAIKKSGAEVWLLTEYEPKLTEPKLKILPFNTQHLIYVSRVFESLVSGQRKLNSPSIKRQILQQVPLGGWCLGILDQASKYFNKLKPRKYYGKSDYSEIDLSKLVDNPYLQHERLEYLKWVDGLLCANKIYLNSMLLAEKIDSKPLELDLIGYDGMISTCPLYIKALNTKFNVQTIHDLIPLEYFPTADRPSIFAQRLQRCSDSARIFVSTATKNKFTQYIKKGECDAETVIIQPPSLNLNPEFTAQSHDLISLFPSSGENRLNSKIIPFRYILFNSAVESRKNLIFAIKAYRESRLGQEGIKLCITGSLKDDDYSRRIESIVSNDKDIILTNYIDEATKRDLFLNAMLLISPSLVEGFGIPVLDAACLGLVALTSPSLTHQEIRNQYDFKNYVCICDNHNSSELAKAMKLFARKEAGPKLETLRSTKTNTKIMRLLNLNKNQIRRNARAERYEYYQKLINQNFQNKIIELITNKKDRAVKQGLD